MLKIDAHQHFWVFNPIRDAWIDDTMAVIRRDFSPSDLAPVLKAHQFDGCVAVQADQSEEQNDFLLDHATKNSMIKGVVGWVDLRAANLEERLQEYQKNPLMKGFRHVLQGEENRALMLAPDFQQGLKLLSKYNFTYDVLIFPDQLKYFVDFLETNEPIRLVLDHIAKPNIKTGTIKDWKYDIENLAAFENVYCKVSGMVTEADWQNWKYEDFEPYLDIVFNTFGIDRLMFGSDWPVCNVAGGFDKMISIVTKYTTKLSQTEQQKFWGGNAQKFYNLK